MATGTINWSDIFAAIDDARKYATDSQSFLHRLERHGLTLLPIAVRRNADLFGVGMVTRIEGHGYATIDPVRYFVCETLEETK